MDNLRRFRIKYRLNETDLSLLLANMEVEYFTKNAHLIEEGRCNNNLYLIEEGVLRCHGTIEGQDNTWWFILPGDITFSSWGYVNGGRSHMSIEAMTDVKAYVISKETLNMLYESSLRMANLGRRLIEQYCLQYDESMLNYEKPTASERYENLLKQYPRILQEVPLQYIASYLRITPQSLSRIRAEIRKK
ncbi:MAG: Crp/Fnr family transcriptional regulator [Bacteroidales bacterium]